MSPNSGASAKSQNDAHARYPSVSTMLSPPGGSAAQALALQGTPNAKQNTPANSPASLVALNGNGIVAPHPTSSPPMPVLYEDPLLQAKLAEVAALQAAQPLSPTAVPATVASSPVGQGGATLTLPHADEAPLPMAQEVLSPSEHPTQTPACSPTAVC